MRRIIPDQEGPETAGSLVIRGPWLNEVAFQGFLLQQRFQLDPFGADELVRGRIADDEDAPVRLRRQRRSDRREKEMQWQMAQCSFEKDLSIYQLIQKGDLLRWL